MITNLINETIKDIWPILIMVLVTLMIFRYLYFKSSREKFKLYQEIINVIFIIYIIFLFTFLSKTDLNSIHGFNLMPFKEITRYDLYSDLFVLNNIGNIVAFLPLGFYLGYFIRKKKLYNTFLAALGISSTVEVVQYFIGRSFDIDDIILNVLGAIVGYAIYLLLSLILRKMPSFLQKDGLYNVVCIIILSGLAIYFLYALGVVDINEML